MSTKQRTMTPEWRKLRKEIIERDSGRCRKCGRSSDLEMHHIVAVWQGGKDDPDNLATLCYVCHREWEYIETGLDLEFEEWLEIPPAVVFIAYYFKRETWNGTAQALRDEFTSAHQRMLADPNR